MSQTVESARNVASACEFLKAPTSPQFAEGLGWGGLRLQSQGLRGVLLRLGLPGSPPWVGYLALPMHTPAYAQCSHNLSSTCHSYNYFFTATPTHTFPPPQGPSTHNIQHTDTFFTPPKPTYSFIHSDGTEVESSVLVTVLHTQRSFGHKHSHIHWFPHTCQFSMQAFARPLYI